MRFIVYDFAISLDNATTESDWFRSKCLSIICKHNLDVGLILIRNRSWWISGATACNQINIIDLLFFCYCNTSIFSLLYCQCSYGYSSFWSAKELYKMGSGKGRWVFFHFPWTWRRPHLTWPANHLLIFPQRPKWWADLQGR